jgi:predicted ester cyclase
MSDDLETRYRAYLDVLNERRLEDLVHYVADRLTYNDETLTGRDYRHLIATDIAAAPDLVYDPHIVVVSGQTVACRLLFRCTPRDRFLGFIPTGEQLRFAEHVFYRFEDGRISAVWSLIDRWSIAEQLRARPGP